MRVPARLARSMAIVAEIGARQSTPGMDRVAIKTLLKDVQTLLNGITDVHRDSSFRVEDPRNKELFEHAKRNAAAHLGAFAASKGLLQVREIGIDPPIPELGRQGMRLFRFSLYSLTPEALKALRTGPGGEEQSILDLEEG